MPCVVVVSVHFSPAIISLARQLFPIRFLSTGGTFERSLRLRRLTLSGLRVTARGRGERRSRPEIVCEKKEATAFARARAGARTSSHRAITIAMYRRR